MALPIDDVSIERSLTNEWARAAIHAPAPMATNDVVGFVTALLRDKAAFERLEAMSTEGAELIATADNYFDDEGRETIARIEAMFRTWSARYATLEIPERHPLAAAMSAWVRPYNDALRAFVRSLDDGAEKLARRLASELEEDADADAWAEVNPPLDPSEETVAWDDVKKRIA